MAAFFEFAVLQTGIILVSLVFVYFSSQYTVTFTNGSSKHTASCHWDQGILYDDDGRTICKSQSYFYGCRDLMKDINRRTNGCVPNKGDLYITYTEDLEVFTEQVTINIIEMTATIGLGLLLVWLLPRLVRRRRTSVYNVMVIFHGAALIFATVYAINANYAMDRLSKKNNYNEGQSVSIGIGFFAVLALPLTLLATDLFIEDWK